MAKPAAGAGSRTYVPESGQDAQIIAFVQALEELGIEPPARRPALVSADGRTIELPEAMFDVLHQVAAALSSGMGVTVAPHNARLTTQEAADFLGMSRPTLVRLLEAGEIPMTKPGRHRGDCCECAPTGGAGCGGPSTVTGQSTREQHST